MTEPYDRFPVPASFARTVAQDAVRRAKAYGSRRRWTGTRRLRPLWAQGVVGIRDPLKFLVYQDRGTPPRTPYELEGKTIPIKNKRTGATRFVKAKGVGQPGWTHPSPGVRVWKNSKWRNQGVKPTHFMRHALNDAIGANRDVLSERLRRVAQAGEHDYFVE